MYHIKKLILLTQKVIWDQQGISVHLTLSIRFTIEERNEFTKFLSEGWVDSFRHLHPNVVKYSYFSARSNAKLNII